MDEHVPDGGFVAALAGLRAMGPRRLLRLLHHHPPAEAFEVVAGRHPPAPSVGRMFTDDLRRLWLADSAVRDPERCWADCQAAHIQVVVHGGPGYPAVLVNDPVPPAALFVRGDLEVLAARRAGVIGTRNATRSGLDTAAALGSDLARAGVAVVSGLARGIDGAVHRGVVAAAGVPIAVVGNGPDHPYPASHRALWDQVCERGVLMSEWPPGVKPDAFRFPLRNRILAALSEVIVVVESRERGGSLSTVREAIERDIEVMAVPGSPRTRASAGTNQLLCEGAAPVTCTDDVLVALGLDTRRKGRVAFDSRLRPDATGSAVLALCRAAPRTLDQVVVALDISVADAAMALARLERSGWLAEFGGWFEVLGPWSGTTRAATCSRPAQGVVTDASTSEGP